METSNAQSASVSQNVQSFVVKEQSEQSDPQIELINKDNLSENQVAVETPNSSRVSTEEITLNKETTDQTENQMETESLTNNDELQQQQNLVPIVEKSDSTNVPTMTTVNDEQKALAAEKSTATTTTKPFIKIEPNHNTFPQTALDKNVQESFATVVVKSEHHKRNLVGAKNFITKSSLSLLAQYDSDSEDESQEKETVEAEDDEIVEVPMEANKDYRNKVIEIHSESESESSTSSSDSDVEYISKIRKEIEKSMDLEEDEGSEDDDADEATAGKNKKKKAQNSMRVKGELGLDDLPPIQDLQITVPEEECVVLGKVHSIVNQLLLVSALPDSTLYDLDTVLFLEKGKKVLGEVFDVLGQVADPLYCVRFNSHKDIEEKNIKIGDAVYVAPKTEHTQFVIMSSLMKMRGSDASWENDVEPPPRYLDYSDDEQEREARQRLRNKDRSANKDYEDHDEATKRPRDDTDETASVSSVNSNNTNDQSQTRYANQNGGRFNRGYTHRPTSDNRRPNRYNNNQSQQQGYPQQMHRNPNAGSWHSNYNRPYIHNRPHMSIPPMMPMNAPYPMFPQYSHFTSAIPPPHTPPMYVQNPYAMRPPQLSPQFPAYSQKTRSPSPPPPGLD